MMSNRYFNEKLKNCLPNDFDNAVLVGRAWIPGKYSGPSPVSIRQDGVYDLSEGVATASALMNSQNPVELVDDLIKSKWAKCIGNTDDLLQNTHVDLCDSRKPYFLAPCDLQAVRACGVTFVDSMVERVIEEHAQGDQIESNRIRVEISSEIGGGLRSVKPGSSEAEKLKQSLSSRGLWSQYLEVGIGPDAEVFNKAQPMSVVGVGAEIGIRSDSKWNNPEPELVLAVNRAGCPVGASLGNDVNLRDFEGRSALLLGKAKDNNASCSIGPFVRLFEDSFTFEEACRTYIEVSVRGSDNFMLDGFSDQNQISRTPSELVSQAINRVHQYPDGLMLFLGTQFAPTNDRDSVGEGFTHKLGDIVSIRAAKIGTLINRVNYCERIKPWTFGVSDLMRNLAKRRLV